ncbi:MAG TPA: PEP-CTERM sorting domain-containing protein [Acetobacteraceae bacterium]|nr:PEP-CTERM sorting domain-containing protein [Acetobacteraceae bacterium]
MRQKLLAGCAVLAAVTLASASQAGAENTHFWLDGAGFSGSGFFKTAPDHIAGDPAGANLIKAISGTISAQGFGLDNEPINGLIKTSPNPGNAPFATSLSYFPASGLPGEDNGALSYSNLLYPGGAPDTCFDGITGGYLDVFGVLFTLSNGDTIDLWSNGGSPNNGPIYGLALVDTTDTAVAYIGGGIMMQVPEPGSLTLLGAGLLGALYWRRSRA